MPKEGEAMPRPYEFVALRLTDQAHFCSRCRKFFLSKSRAGGQQSPVGQFGISTRENRYGVI
jgi:hypothetical protein